MPRLRVGRTLSQVTSPDVFVSADEGGEIDGVKVFGLVDDLQIYARLTNIDGPGETLGSAGPREYARAMQNCRS